MVPINSRLTDSTDQTLQKILKFSKQFMLDSLTAFPLYQKLRRVLENYYLSYYSPQCIIYKFFYLKKKMKQENEPICSSQRNSYQKQLMSLSNFEQYCQSSHLKLIPSIIGNVFSTFHRSPIFHTINLLCPQFKVFASKS